MTQEDLTALTRKAKFVMVDDDADLTEASIPLAPQMQIQNQLPHLIEELKLSNGSQMEVIPSEPFQSIWGRTYLEEPLVDVNDIMNIDKNDLLHLNTPEMNQPEEDNYHLNNCSSIPPNLMMSQRDPMMMTRREPMIMMTQRDPVITHGPMAVMRNYGPVVLQQRIQSDSAAKKTDPSVKAEEAIASKSIEAGGQNENGTEKRKQGKKKGDQNNTSKGKKLKADDQISFVENVPIFTLLFMLLLVIFKFIGETVIEMSHFVIVIQAMAVAIFITFFKNNTN